jgi:hypothetical protein
MDSTVGQQIVPRFLAAGGLAAGQDNVPVLFVATISHVATDRVL